ncbi:dihydroxyacetone kinase family protein [Ancylobacter lacus]|uniref:dihydroxyacetone kinase family protein n=1 Tax=Ancylobacter lacus TaxID=2579970 RepID=UPI001BCF45FD|nr:dihydroxyacetone kinase family protein [Ancylobacter lacus]MBS7538047.1 dihydroxyacetone kinase subunit DhaK [Ancylobacter lacus]
MKKLINDPRAVVPEMLRGAVSLAPAQARLAAENVVVRHPLPAPEARPIAVLSGGGSGHEPAHAGYVGAGMLTAAVAGDVFTSPSTDAVLAGLNAVAGPAGALLIVKNYTGDRLNFGLAAEIARGAGTPVEIVVVADDVALRETVPKARRRGIAGTVLVHKVAGAAAQSGLPLERVAELARAAAADVGSMGIGLEPCIVPAAGKAGFELGADEIELGLGIHGEPGVRRGPMQPADALVATMLTAIIDDLGLSAGERCVLLVNGLGGTPPMELDIVAGSALAQLQERGLTVERAWRGTLLSALDMRGCSLSLMKVDDARLALLDAATTAPAWPGSGRLNPQPVLPAGPAPEVATAAGPLTAQMRAFRAAVLAAATALEAAEPRLTELDARTGDGDLGASLARGAAAVRALPESAWSGPAEALAAIGNAMRQAIGGSSGPFYATGLLRAARALGSETPGPREAAEAFAAGVAAVAELGGGNEGDRTMLDALFPAARAMAEQAAAGGSLAEALAAAADAAEQGAAATARMAPKLGRASYLGERALGIEDGGAVAVGLWLRALADVARD